MILIFCLWTYVMVPRGERGKENETEREIPAIQLDRWITSENYQLNRDSKYWSRWNDHLNFTKKRPHQAILISVLQMHYSFISQMCHVLTNMRPLNMLLPLWKEKLSHTSALHFFHNMFLVFFIYQTNQILRFIPLSLNFSSPESSQHAKITFWDYKSQV